MHSTRLLRSALTALMLCGVLAQGAYAQQGRPQGDGQDQSRGKGYTVKATLSEGPSTVEYSPMVTETLKWGPTALAVAPDGSYWISDSVGDDLVHIDAAGKMAGSIDLSGRVVGVTDLVALPSGLYALDGVARTPKVLRLTYDGKLIATHPVPGGYQSFVTGLTPGENGELLLERRTMTNYRLLDAEGNAAGADIVGPTVSGRTIRSRPSLRSEPSRGVLTIGTAGVSVRVPNYLVGLRTFGTEPGGRSFFVTVDEMTPDTNGYFRVDQVVRRYGFGGRLLGVARFPLADQYIGVANPLATGPDGGVYGLITRSTGVSVVKLEFTPTVDPIFAPGSVTTSGSGYTAGGHISRETIETNSWRYINNLKYLSATATDGACSGRDKPGYLRGAGSYYGVSYDWGGWDTVDGFNWHMDNGYQAGDVPITNVGFESCSRGVDCSGFVTRVWGRTDKKYATATLGEISHKLAGPWVLKTGDVMNWPTEHVRLVDFIDGNGAVIWESTAYAGADRVIYRYAPWSSFAKYQPRRYNYLSNP